jgi:hypothetical protein
MNHKEGIPLPNIVLKGPLLKEGVFSKRMNEPSSN